MEEYRCMDLAKHTKLFIYAIISDKEEEEAKELLISFLREFVKKANIKNKIIQYNQKSK